MNELAILQQEVAELRGIVNALVYSDRYIFQKNIQLMDGRNIQLAKGVGTKFGTEATQKLAFFGATPVIRQSAISAPSGGVTVDSQARSAISSLITALQTFGLIS